MNALEFYAPLFDLMVNVIGFPENLLHSHILFKAYGNFQNVQNYAYNGLCLT